MATIDPLAKISIVRENLYFGAYPVAGTLKALKELGVEVVVDHTTLQERKDHHITKLRWRGGISVPIGDRKVAEDEEIEKLIASIGDRSVAIFCRGGHGRSACTAAILLGRRESLSGAEAIEEIHTAHQNRPSWTGCEKAPSKQRFKRLGAPQTKAQKAQIKRLLDQ